MNGVLNILKPTGMSSHDVVSFVRRTYNTKKVGHAGTLDPNVSGVLPICVGKATKFSDVLINGDKVYVCEILFGSSTDTQDMYGKVVNETKEINDENYIKNIDIEKLKETILSFKGTIKQIPPAYSAVKLNGKKLYEYARQDIVVEKAAREICIKELEILKINFPSVLIKVRCSKGTYMRTLCHDIGNKFGIYAHMGVLVRVEAKGLKIEDSVTLEELKYHKDLGDTTSLEKYLIKVDDIVPMKKAYVNSKYYQKLIVGNEVYCPLNEEFNGDFYVYCDNNLIGIGHKVNEKQVKIDKMLIDR